MATTNARIQFSTATVEEWEKVNPKLREGEPVIAKKPNGKYILKVGTIGGSTYKDSVLAWDQDDAEAKMNTSTTAAVNAKASATAAKASQDAAKASETAAKASQTASASSATEAASSASAAKTSETNAANSASTATSKATAASSSASAAKTSETNAGKSASAASTSEANALKSANAASASESNAKASATVAKASQDAAKASETAAKASQTASASSATEAASSASAAKNSETNAANSASTAADSAKASANSATASAGSATKAATSETNAKASETASATSEKNAKVSETNAKTSETNAVNSAKAAAQSEANAKVWDPTQYVSKMAANQLLRNKAYAVGDIAYSPNLPSYLYLECITAGTTGATEPDMSTIKSGGITLNDGTVVFNVMTVCAREYVKECVQNVDVQIQQKFDTSNIQTGTVTTTVSRSGGGWLKKITVPVSFPDNNYCVIACLGNAPAYFGSAIVAISEEKMATEFQMYLWISASDNISSIQYKINYLAIHL